MNNGLSVNHYICGAGVSFPVFAESAARAGLSAVGLSRAAVEEMGVAALRRCLADHGLGVSSLNSVGYFTDADRVSVDRGNLMLIEAAAELDADVLCVICGGLGVPPMPLEQGHALVRDGFDALARRAEQEGVRLGVEPIHPMDIGTKGCVNSVAQARALIDGYPSAGLILDFYHSWWDPDMTAIIRDFPDDVVLVQLCNIRMDTGVPVGRETLAAGDIDVGAHLHAVLEAGYRGIFELEIFAKDIPGRDPLKIVAGFPADISATMPAEKDL